MLFLENTYNRVQQSFEGSVYSLIKWTETFQNKNLKEIKTVLNKYENKVTECRQTSFLCLFIKKRGAQGCDKDVTAAPLLTVPPRRRGVGLTAKLRLALLQFWLALP